jgi:predicted RNA-binding Zn-ribbon protein involved in translation (DUF1610 family)
MVTTIIAVIVVIFIFLFAISFCISSLSKSMQKLKQHNRCEACKSRLKAVNGQYALVCRKCGHTQSWATQVSAKRSGSVR